MNHTRLLLLALTVSTLSACGGGGAEGPTTPAPVPTPTPAPTPSPSPSPAPTPTPTPAPGAYTVTGRVITANGEPIANAEVTASHTASTTSRSAVTDAQGRYILTLPQTLGSWNVVAYLTLTYSGSEHSVRLNPDVDVPFSGLTGASRDFTFKASDVPMGKVFDYIDNSDVEVDWTTMEVTFTPDGTNAAGQTQPITVKYPFGYGLPDMPLGDYYVSASHLRNGVKEQLLVVTRTNPNYATRTLARFTYDSH